MSDIPTGPEKIREYCRTHPEVFDDTTEVHALAEGQIYRARYDAVRDRVDVDHALADGTTLDTASWWGRAVDPGLRRLADADLVEYRAVDDTYRWVGDNR